jgi:hypothetical protein
LKEEGPERDVYAYVAGGDDAVLARLNDLANRRNDVAHGTPVDDILSRDTHEYSESAAQLRANIPLFTRGYGRLAPEDFMSILAAIKREEQKVKRQLGKLQHQLNGLQAAAKALANSASRDLAGVKKRVMSEASRAKISKAAKQRWAKIKAQAKKAAR